MSSTTDEWATPQILFDKLNREFLFNTDVCANLDNAKCTHFFSKEEDGLSKSWNGTCWMNPPYGREIAKWMQKAHESAKCGAIVVCLVPSRTDTRWWHDFVMPYYPQGVRFIKGRVHFNDAGPAPFPSAIVVMK